MCEMTIPLVSWSMDSTLRCNLNKIPKWETQSNLFIHEGKFPFCTGSTSLVTSCATSLILPKFHQIFDGSFTTINALRNVTSLSNCNDLLRTSIDLTNASCLLKINLQVLVFLIDTHPKNVYITSLYLYSCPPSLHPLKLAISMLLLFLSPLLPPPSPALMKFPHKKTTSPP